MKVKPKYLFFIWIGLYFLFLILNLDRIPVAWTDETQLLDPAARFVFNGKFCTTLYPFQSSTEVFAASLPFIQFVYILVLKFLGTEIFWIRVPMVIAAFLSIFTLHSLLKNKNYHPVILLIIPMLFLHDKAVYEMIRAGRMEIFSALFILLSYYWLNQRKYILSTFSISLLILTHPAVWTAGLVLFLYGWFQTKQSTNKLILPFIVLTPTLFWLWFIDFNFLALKDQLIGQGEYHSSQYSPGNYFSNLFWYRFWPFWKEQPYMVLMHVWAIGYSIYQLIKLRKPSDLILEFCFLFTEIFMAFKLATHHRYNVILVVLICLLLAKALNKNLTKIGLKRLKLAFILLLPLILFPYVSRNAIGLIERNERDPDAILKWVDKWIPQKDKTLLSGSDILHYYAIEKSNFIFFEKIYPQQIDYNKYNNFYMLLECSPHKDAVEIATYCVEKNSWSKKLDDYVDTKNYNGLVLYKIPNKKTLEEITEPYNHDL